MGCYCQKIPPARPDSRIYYHPSGADKNKIFLQLLCKCKSRRYTRWKCIHVSRLPYLSARKQPFWWWPMRWKPAPERWENIQKSISEMVENMIRFSNSRRTTQRCTNKLQGCGNGQESIYKKIKNIYHNVTIRIAKSTGRVVRYSN